MVRPAAAASAVARGERPAAEPAKPGDDNRPFQKRELTEAERMRAAGYYVPERSIHDHPLAPVKRPSLRPGEGSQSAHLYPNYGLDGQPSERDANTGQLDPSIGPHKPNGGNR